MEGGTWECMVIIMPPLSESQQPDDPLVATPIVRLELAFAKRVTDRIDAPGHVVREEDARQASPEETGPSAKRKWDEQREYRPEQEGAADEGDHRVLCQVTAIHVWICRTVIEEPAEMCVKESLYRAMGITLTVSLRMMFDVRCCPLKSRTFPRHGTKDE